MSSKQQQRGIHSEVLGQAKGLMARTRQITGVDLNRLAQMSDEEWGQIADRAHEMKRLVDALPILEKHFETLIQGQLQYEEFVQRVLKDAEKAGKKIDKLVMDAWLLDRGYSQHQQLMRQKAGLEANLQDAEFSSQINLNQLDFNTALQLVRLKHQRQADQVRQRIPETMRQMEFAEQQRLANQKRRDLLTYGSRGNPSKRNWGDRISSFFTGR